MSEYSSLAHFFDCLLKQAVRDNHRQVLVLPDGENQAEKLADQILIENLALHSVWVGDELPDAKDYERCLIKHSQSILGREFRLAVMDCRKNFHGDTFGRLSGCLMGGGVLILLTPDLSCLTESNSRFSRRLAKIINNSKDCHLWPDANTEHAVDEPRIDSGSVSRISKSFLKEQEAAVESIIKTVTGERKHPTIIHADRGRGKSAALGIAAARLIERGYSNILLTSHHKHAVENVYHHAELVQPNAKESIAFLPPADLIAAHHECDVLLVDEAASLPLNQLVRLLAMYSRIVFSSTLAGYEGTGQGFALRFIPMVKSQSRGYYNITIETPCRWNPGDPLEQLAKTILILDPDVSRDLFENQSSELPEQCTYRFIDRDELIDEPLLLHQVFSLLMLAHYRTRPVDLQFLLDDPDLEIIVGEANSETIAVVCIRYETNTDSETAKRIFEGRRRPGKNLISESLIGQMGVDPESVPSFCRIVRIVTHPGYQNQGIGSELLQYAIACATERGYLIATSFAMAESTWPFWIKNRFSAVRVGMTSNKYTSTPSCLAIHNTASNQSLLQNLTENLLDFFSVPGHLLNTMDASLIQLILKSIPLETCSRQQFSQHELRLLDSVAHSSRNPDTIPVLLRRLALHCLVSGFVDYSDSSLPRILIERGLQRRTWKNCSLESGATGKKQLLGLLRTAVSESLKQL